MCLWVAALAASLVVFESPARAVEVPRVLVHSLRLAGDGPARVTLPLEPTHLAFSWTGSEGSGVRFRTVAATGRTGRWRRAPEAHDAERGNRHFSGVLLVPRPEAVVWATAVPEGGWIGSVVLDVINSVDGPTVTVEVPVLPRAAPRAPDIVTRAEWGADESLKQTSGACRRSFYDVQQLFVHHTAGRNKDPNPAATMRAIFWYHTVRQGWCDVGYNFVLGSDGRIYEGRWARHYKPWELHTSEDVHGRAVAGAHTSGYNSASIGISLMGNFQRAPVPEKMKRALAEFLAWESDRHGLKPRGFHTYRNPETGGRRRLPYIAGHRDAGSTSCPGGHLYASLRRIRADAEAVIGGGKTATATSFPVPSHTEYGTPVTISGRLIDEDGSGLAGRQVKIYSRRGRGRWRVEALVTSGIDGAFSVRVSPAARLKLVAVYEGDAATWGSQSRTGVLRVRPQVTLAPEGGSSDVLGVHHYPSGTSSVRFSGEVTPAHPGWAVKLAIGRVEDDGSFSELENERLRLDPFSRYGYSFSVPRPGRYRATARFVRDGDHAAGFSEPVTFEISSGELSSRAS